MIVRDMRAPRPETKDPGLLTVKDFAAYRPVWRTPVHTTYRGRDVFARAAGDQRRHDDAGDVEHPGGLRPQAMGEGSAQAITAISEAQKIAWADRGAYLADPAFVRQPITQLLSKDYAAQRRAADRPDQGEDVRAWRRSRPRPAATARAAGADFNPPARRPTSMSSTPRAAQ